MSNDVTKLQRALEDPEYRVQLNEIQAIITLLHDCIIDSTYTLSDDWIRPIKLSTLGEEIKRRCLELHRRLKPNDATMAVFLAFGCASGLLVDVATDVISLRHQLSKEILNQHVRYPYIFGRELHDLAAETYPGRTHLDAAQTIELLRKLPMGVFQEGRTVVGPFGCTYSDVPRQLSPILYVPGYYCSDESCSAIHSITLNTGESRIRKANRLIGDYISKHHSETADEHVPLVRESLTKDILPWRINSSDNLIDVLSDGISESELRSVIDLLLRRCFKKPEGRTDISKRLGAAIANPSEFVSSIDRSHLINIALLFGDAEVIRAVDEAIRTDRLIINEYELRVSKLRRWDPHGNAPDAQIGKLGVRFISAPSDPFITQRMLRLLHSIYYDSGVWDAADLAYALEAPPDFSAADLLDRAVHDLPPSEIFRRLILPNRRVAELAAEILGIYAYDTLSREARLEHMLWKAGVGDNVSFDELYRIRQHATNFTMANERHEEDDVLRAHSANLFAAIEQALRRSLNYCTWALTVDHYLSKAGFEYDPLMDASVLKFIEDHAPADEAELQLRTDGINTLVPLSAGFARLAKCLRKLDPSGYQRAEYQVPAECEALSRPFAFESAIPFFNLAESARSTILTSLQTVSRLLQDETVGEVRNAPTHGRPFPTSEQIRYALERIDLLVHELESSGLCPRLYNLQSISRDGLGRRSIIYERDGEHITLVTPQWAVAPRIPFLHRKLVIMRSAKTLSSGPLRFRLKDGSGDDEYWNGWPKRWQTRVDYRSLERPDPHPDSMSETA